jgi:hypothetical protein
MIKILDNNNERIEWTKGCFLFIACDFFHFFHLTASVGHPDRQIWGCLQVFLRKFGGFVIFTLGAQGIEEILSSSIICFKRIINYCKNVFESIPKTMPLWSLV